MSTSKCKLCAWLMFDTKKKWARFAMICQSRLKSSSFRKKLNLYHPWVGATKGVQSQCQFYHQPKKDFYAQTKKCQALPRRAAHVPQVLWSSSGNTEPSSESFQSCVCVCQDQPHGTDFFIGECSPCLLIIHLCAYSAKCSTCYVHCGCVYLLMLSVTWNHYFKSRQGTIDDVWSKNQLLHPHYFASSPTRTKVKHNCPHCTCAGCHFRCVIIVLGRHASHVFSRCSGCGGWKNMFACTKKTVANECGQDLCLAAILCDARCCQFFIQTLMTVSDWSKSCLTGNWFDIIGLLKN